MTTAADGHEEPGGPGRAGRPVAPRVPSQPVPFEVEIRAAQRYERGLAVKAAVLIAALAVLFVLRALYFA